MKEKLNKLGESLDKLGESLAELIMSLLGFSACLWFWYTILKFVWNSIQRST